MDVITKPNIGEDGVVGVNKTVDLGALLLEDSQSFQGKTEKEILELTKQNYC